MKTFKEHSMDILFALAFFQHKKNKASRKLCDFLLKTCSFAILQRY